MAARSPGSDMFDEIVMADDRSGAFGGTASGPPGGREGGSAEPGRDGGAKRKGKRIAACLSLQVSRGGLPGGVRRGQPGGGC